MLTTSPAACTLLLLCCAIGCERLGLKGKGKAVSEPKSLGRALERRGFRDGRQEQMTAVEISMLDQRLMLKLSPEI